MIIRIELDEKERPIVVGYQKYDNGWKYSANNEKNIVTVRNPDGDYWTFKNYQILQIVKLLLGKNEIHELRHEYQKTRSKSKFNRWVFRNILKLIKYLRKFLEWLNA